MNRFSYYYILTLITLVFLVPANVEAQAGGTSATLKGAVSETVALSTLPNSTPSNAVVEVVSNNSIVRITLVGTDAKSSVIRVPLIVRSNCRFRISAVVESKTAELSQLSVIDARAMGPLVSPEAISELDVPQQLDLRGLDKKASLATSSLPLDVSRPFVVLNGPRVSLGGMLDSANNALQITLLIRLRPEAMRDWLVHLTFTGTPVTWGELR